MIKKLDFMLKFYIFQKHFQWIEIRWNICLKNGGVFNEHKKTIKNWVKFQANHPVHTIQPQKINRTFNMSYDKGIEI